MTLEGMVRGKVTFLNAEDKDRIDLGSFRRTAGSGKTVPEDRARRSAIGGSSRIPAC